MMMAILLLLSCFLSSLPNTVLGRPEAHFSRLRELSSPKYHDDYKVFIDEVAIDVPASKNDRPNFSWDIISSPKEPDSTSTIKPDLEEQNQNGEHQDKNIRADGRGIWRKNKNRNELHAPEGSESDRQLHPQEQTQEFNVTNVYKIKDSAPGTKGRRQRNKNRKNKRGHRRQNKDKNGTRKNKNRKSERKNRRGRKQKERNIHKNDLPELVQPNRQLHNIEDVPLDSSIGTTSDVRKADDIFMQMYQNPKMSVSQNANETNAILDVQRNLQETNNFKYLEVDEDNTLPIINPGVTNIGHTKINSLKNVSDAFQHFANASIDIIETESATVELDINRSSDTYVQFFDEQNTTNRRDLLNSSPRSELENGSNLDREEKEYNALNDIVGDISCLAGTFLPAPPSPHSAIRYVRTQTLTAANLVAEYECEPMHHLENAKDFQVICSERKWMGTVPSCVPDSPLIENRAACNEGKGSCDHLCEIVGNNSICTCYRGFYLENSVCRDINECELDNGGCESGCRNTPGAHHCTCPPGLRLADNRMTCIDINECLLRNGHGPCQDMCHNKWGAYECSCKGITGTRLAADNHTCQDIDECADGTAGCSHTCLNTFGSAFCICPSGFMLGDDWKTCQEAKEAVCPPLESPLHGYWECARHLLRTKKSKFPWLKRTRVVNHAGAICQLKCPPDFILEGEFRKTCGEDSKWKGPEDGTCVRKLDYMFNVILKA